MSQPTEDVRITPQLFQGMDLGIFVTEIKEEVANDTAILTSRSWTECASDVLDSTREQPRSGCSSGAWREGFTMIFPGLV